MKLNYFPQESFYESKNSDGTTSIRIREFPTSNLFYLNGKATTDNSVGLADASPDTISNIVLGKDETLDNPSFYNAKNTSVKYSASNFIDFNYGTINFKIRKKAENTENYGELILKDFVSPTVDTDFSIITYTNTIEDSGKVMSLTLPSGADINYLVNIISDGIGNPEFKVGTELSVEKIIDENNIRLTTKVDGEVGIKIKTSGLSKVFSNGDNDNYFHYWNFPEKQSNIFMLKGKNNSNEIRVFHDIDGFLKMDLYDESIDLTEPTKTITLCQFNFTSEDTVSFEIDFNTTNLLFFINDNNLNGKGPENRLILNQDITFKDEDSGLLTQLIRKDPKTNLFLGGEDSYHYYNVSVYNKVLHMCSFYNTLEYDGTGYVEYDYSNISTIYDNCSLNGILSADSPTNPPFLFEMVDGVYSFASSNSFEDFKQEIEDFKFNGNDECPDHVDVDDLKFRITFKNKSSYITSFEFNEGQNQNQADDPYSFEDIFEWMRRRLGAPQVPVELTNEQMMDALEEAVFEYNRYRNVEELNKKCVSGSDDLKLQPDGGYSLPKGIAKKDIIDILIKPRNTWAWFGGSNYFMNNIFMQSFFNYGNIIGGTADMFIYRTSLYDMENIMGTRFSWEVHDNELYLHPDQSIAGYFNIAIKYQAPISVEEIRNTFEIKQLALAYAMINLGNIRGTFTNGIPGGDAMIQLNSSDLISRGEALRDKYIDLMMKKRAPLFMIWS